MLGRVMACYGDELGVLGSKYTQVSAYNRQVSDSLYSSGDICQYIVRLYPLAMYICSKSVLICQGLGTLDMHLVVYAVLICRSWQVLAIAL